MNPFKKDGKSVSIFITAGYPEKDSLIRQIPRLQEQGIDFIEIGIPFSDPLADGPVIQETSLLALKNGMTIPLLFEQLSVITPPIHIPLVIMSYLNPILQFGADRFLEQCKLAGIAGLIIPDLSLELVRKKYAASFGSGKIPLIYLITPYTPDSRVSETVKASADSFVYLVGQNKITGASYSLAEQADRYSDLKRLCADTPLFLGFGISTPEQKKEAFQSVDGVIVGTAYLRAILEGKEKEFIEKLRS